MYRLILIVAVAPSFAMLLGATVAASIRLGPGFGGRRAVEQIAPALYAATVCVAALVAAALEGFSAERLGLIRDGAAPVWVAVTAVCAVPIGALGYAGELFVSHRAVLRRTATASPVGAAGSAGMRSLGHWSARRRSVLALGLVTAVAEELLFRGYLLTGLRASIPLAAALALQAAVFSAHHASFGFRAVPAKAVHGLVWGALTVAAGTLLPALIAHCTFQLLVQRRLNRPGPALATGAVPDVRLSAVDVSGGWRT